MTNSYFLATDTDLRRTRLQADAAARRTGRRHARSVSALGTARRFRDVGTAIAGIVSRKAQPAVRPGAAAAPSLATR